MGKTTENNGKNPKRDDFGMVGNMGLERPILFPRVSQETMYPKRGILLSYNLLKKGRPRAPKLMTWMLKLRGDIIKTYA